MSDVLGLACCGIKELEGIIEDDDPVDSIKSYVTSGWSGAFVVYSDISDDFRIGENLTDYIRTQELGTVQSQTSHNPNSGNELRMYVWKIDRTKLAEWAVRHKLRGIR